MKTYYEQVTEKLDYKNTLFKYIDSHPERPIYLCIDDQFKALDKYLNKNDLAFLMQSLLFKYIFYKAGEKIFTFSPDLLKLLSHTSLEKINTETLQLPFESIFFHDLSSLNMRLEEKEYYLQSAFIMRIPALKIAPVLDLWEELVRGHWRNQPVGEGRKETKLIWIKPFRKGSEMAELIDKKYKVK